MKCRWDCHVGKTELQEEQHILDTVIQFFKLFIPRKSDQYIHLLQPTKWTISYTDYSIDATLVCSDINMPSWRSSYAKLKSGYNWQNEIVTFII